MKTVYGAPSTGVPISDTEWQIIRDGAQYSKELMLSQLLSMTEVELALKMSGGDAGSIDYDYSAFRAEDNIFAAGSIVHVLRHLRYDRHELHAHNYFEVACQLAGEGGIDVETQHIAMRAGDICLIAPGVQHRLSAFSDEAVVLKVIMRRSDFDSIYRHMLRSSSVLTRFFQSSLYGEGAGWLLFETGDDAEISDTLLRMRYHEVRASVTDDIMKEALVMQLFCYLTERHIDKTRAAFGSDAAGRILVYISENFRTVTLEELEREFHFSGNYISRIIRRASGRSFCELLNGIRVDHACRLLETTELTIQEIVYESGFGCREFFYKTFRRMKGMTPAAWRRERLASQTV